MMPDIRCLVVGAGLISNHMLRAWTARPQFRAVGLVDTREEALQATGDAFGVPVAARFTDLTTALAACAADVVMINTPSEWHYAQTQAALIAGKHVLVAKPFTNNFEQAVELVRQARERNLTLSVIQQVRYNRHYTAVRQYLSSGALGCVEAAWFMNSKPRPHAANLAALDQPALYEMACHHFDSLLAVFGDPTPEWISCDGFRPSWSPYAGPCMVNALIRFSGNLHLAYHGGFSSRAPMYEFRLEGEQGALRCHGLHMSNDTMSYEFAPALGQFAPAAIDAEIPLCDPFLLFFDRWEAYLRGGEEPPFSGRNNLKVFALLSAAIDSVTSEQPVTIAGNLRYAAAFSAEGAWR